MSERVSAIPSRLIRYATESNGIADDLRVAAGALDDAVDHVRVRRTDLASAVPDLGALLLRLAMQARAIGEFAHTIGAAFAEAGGADAHGVVQADACAVDIAAARGWRPRRALTAMTNAAWWHAVWRDRCDGGTSFYGGAGSAIRGPDGRLYPLVAPSIMRDGRVYNADWGREGQPRVGDLFGADPGWHVVDVETGVERHRDAPSLFERLMIGVGATVAGPPLASSEADVELVVLEPGRRPRVEKVSEPRARLYDRSIAPPSPDLPSVPPPPPLESAAAAAVSLAPTALDATLGALTADDGAHHAFQIVFEENDDGRVRATYLRVDVLPATSSEPLALVPKYVVGPSVNDTIPVRYLGPESATMRAAASNYVVSEPLSGAIPGEG